jgi:hypothetical protein
MSWVTQLTYTILIVVALLFLFWQYLGWRYKRQLNKLKEAYNPQDDTSRYKDRGSVEAGLSKPLQREPNIEGDAELEGRRLLENADTGAITDDKPESIEPKPKRSFFRRKKEVNPIDTENAT